LLYLVLALDTIFGVFVIALGGREAQHVFCFLSILLVNLDGLHLHVQIGRRLLTSIAHYLCLLVHHDMSGVSILLPYVLAVDLKLLLLVLHIGFSLFVLILDSLALLLYQFGFYLKPLLLFLKPYLSICCDFLLNLLTLLHFLSLPIVFKL
jgi:hypothetical protein